MSDLILHHYPESPFSEKIRLLLGYKGQAYKGVHIPIIMPKPDLMPLTGGYRKTPVLQIGADIYCDTALIARLIDRLYPDPTIYPDAIEASGGAMAHWTDTFFFKVCVAVAFQPKALANSPLFTDDKAAEAFARDREELTRGSSELRMEFETAHPHFLAHLKRLDNQLSDGRKFLFGDAPTIADFSTYHCCWFIYNNEAIRDIFDPFKIVLTWLNRMAAFDEAGEIEISGKDALEIARQSEPEKEAKIAAMNIDGLAAGDMVEVMPIDYGFNPVRGELMIASLEELVVLRQDDQAGQVAVHFPRFGFQIKKVKGN